MHNRPKNETKKLLQIDEVVVFDKEKKEQKKFEDNQIMIDSVPAMIFYKDKENRFIRTNKFFEDAMVMPKEDLEGKSLFDIYPKEQAEAFWKDDLEVIKTGLAKRNIIEPIKTINGTRILQTDKIPHFDEKGNVTGVIGFSIDITEWENMQKEIVKSERKYGALADNISDPITAYDSNMRCIFRNKAAEADLGMSREQTFGKTFDELHPEMVGSNIHEAYLQALASKQPGTFETHWINKKTGKPDNHELNIYPMEDGGIVIISKDVTEHKKMEEELERVKMAVENASDVIFITDNKGKIIYINKAVKKIFGYCQKDFIGKRLNFWMDTMPNKFFSRMWQSIYVDKVPFVGEITERKKDGDIFTAEIRMAPVLDKNGEILSFVGIERDITEIKRIDSAKTEFISLAAHQLRTPITSVSLTAEMLLNGLAGEMDSASAEHLHEIMSGVKRMSQMIDLFLNVSRIEMKTFEITAKPSDIVKIIEENITAVLPQITAKEIKITKNISADLPIINADQKVLDIILDNLLSNAIKYTPSKGTVSILAERLKNDIVIKVSDTGCGIPKELQSKVFEKLFRVEKEAQKVEGIGLGLYLSKSLIEQAGGKIWVDSELGQGSTFYLSVPISGMKGKQKPH